MASGVTVDGQEVVVPGVYNKTDVSRAQTPGIVTAGIPCLVGTAEDGEPQTVLTFNSLDQVRATFRSGDILEAAEIVYDAVRDDRIQGRPSTLLVVKVNSDTQSVHTFNSASGPAMTVTSTGYGSFSERVSVNIVAGTNNGINLTIALDGVSENVDDLGGEDLFSLAYAGSATTMTATVDATGMFCEQTFTNIGLDLEVVAGYTATDAPRVVSAHAYDDYQVATVYGISGGVAVSEQLTLQGVTPVLGSVAMDEVTGVSFDALTGGIVSVSDQQGAPNVVVTHAADLAAVHVAGVLRVKSTNNVADIGQLVSIRGRSALGTPLSEVVTLNGTTKVPTVGLYTKISSVVITGETLGTVTVEDSATTVAVSIGTGIDQYAGLYLEAGILYLTDLSVDGALTLAVDAGGSVKNVVIRGVTSVGTVANEVIVLGGAAPATVTTTNLWKTVSQIELGAVENARTVTFSGRSFTALLANGFDDFDVLDAYVNSKPGFTLVLLATDIGTRVLSEADYLAGAVIKSATVGFTADLTAAIEWINTNSALITAVRVSGGTGELSVLATPQYLSGGSDATATAADYDSAFTLLKSTELDYVGVLSSSAAVHAFAEAHAIFMAGALGRSDRSIYVGAAASTTKTALKAATAIFSTSRHMNMSYQEIKRRNSDGDLTWYAPIFAAALQMGAQASVRRGVPLTHKRANILATREHSTIDSTVDAGELIKAGISNIISHPTMGYIWQRTVTTYTRRTINAFQESSANDAANGSIKNLRNELDERIVGQADVDTSPAAIKRLTEDLLEAQVSSKLISDFENVTVAASGTQVAVAYGVAPALPRNFVVLTTHLFETSAAA